MAIDGNQLFQHILVFGKPGHFVTRVDNDVNTERVFTRYDDALLYVIGVLAQSRTEEGVRLDGDQPEHVRVL